MAWQIRSNRISFVCRAPVPAAKGAPAKIVDRVLARFTLCVRLRLRTTDLLRKMVELIGRKHFTTLFTTSENAKVAESPQVVESK